ncbi:S-adenosyl-L-methionine-dependent methyltransferase [Dentipellis sp. KUC8613]|nr:S-adenosyl-L-methionine-dependent methyltransferase [Dentipellis sp. KUC8613]
MPRPTTARLLKTLAAAIGSESAHMELKWMQQALASAGSGRGPAVPDLPTMVARRATGEPLQYILGTQPFGPLHLRCRAPVLIPRPETEDWALRLSDAVAPSPSQPVRALDLCTGSGCIPLLLCARWPAGSVRAVAVDHSRAALQLAADNADACGVPVRLLERSDEDEDEDKGDAEGSDVRELEDEAWAGNDGQNTNANANTLTLLGADVLDPARLRARLPLRRFDVVTANPPYITRAAYAALPPSVRAFEDRTALLGDPPGAREDGGLTFYRALARLFTLPGLLAPRARVALEVGEGQARDVADIVSTEGGLGEVEVWADPWGKERVVVARAGVDV